MPARSLQPRRAQLLLPLHELAFPVGLARGCSHCIVAIEGDCREREKERERSGAMSVLL